MGFRRDGMEGICEEKKRESVEEEKVRERSEFRVLKLGKNTADQTLG